MSVPDGAEVLVVVPALASSTEALTGAVDDRRHDAEATAAALESRLPGARAEVGADDPALAVEDALRVFGADEVLVAGDDGMLEAIRERVALPGQPRLGPSYFPAEEETYFATAWIWAGLSFPWNAGIEPPPTIT